MKKLFLGILIIMCFAVTGCSSSKGKLLINCNSEESTIKVKKNATFKCTFINKEFEYKIVKIESNKITIEASDTGVTKVSDKGTINLLDKETKFIIEKDKELVLEPQITDGGFEMLIINWKK